MVTLKDLALKLNVSVSTVSKALHDNPEISQNTINRVKKEAKIHNYQPNRIALSLKSNSTKTIGVIIPSILNRFFAKALNGIEKEAREKGYNIITCMSNELLDKEKECIQLLSNGSVDGFIVAVSEETQKKADFTHFKLAQLAKTPIVMFDRVLDNFHCDKVIIDDYKTAKNITQKLIAKGKKNIAFISSIDDLNVGELRKNGYNSAVKTHQKPIHLTINTNEDIQFQIKHFLKRNKKTDAVISADNISGTIFINVANDLKYKIPKQLSVIGFADEQISNLTVPRLSYINQNAEQIGSRALKLMIKRLKNKKKTTSYTTEKVATSFTLQESF